MTSGSAADKPDYHTEGECEDIREEIDTQLSVFKFDFIPQVKHSHTERQVC